MNDEYEVDGVGFIEFDEDSYCAHATSSLADFLGLDFEWFRSRCESYGWTFNLIPF